jgi:hypothetical protein
MCKWGYFLTSLKFYVEAGTGMPYPDDLDIELAAMIPRPTCGHSKRDPLMRRKP